MTEINKVIENDIYQIEVTGEIDARTSLELDDAINEAIGQEQQKIIIDLSGLGYISSAGLGVFISHIEDIQSKNKRLVLCGMIESVMEVFDILGLRKILTITETKQEAMDLLNES